jgi:hypothetical protein
MATMYYSRMRIITTLLPLLLASTLPSPTIISVYAAGIEGKFYLSDLSLRNLKLYSYIQARSHMVYMHTLFFEELAAKNPGKMTLVHIFPGLVAHEGFKSKDLPAWFRWLFWGFVMPVFGRFITLKHDESGERMISLASDLYWPAVTAKDGKNDDAVVGEKVKGTNGEQGSGVYSLNWDGERKFPDEKYEAFNRLEMRKRVWEHTMGAFEAIEKNEMFTG